MYPKDQKILVVDDDDSRRKLIDRLLVAEGFTVTAAAGGFAALGAVARQRFVLIVAGTGIPGTLDGPATVRRSRGLCPGLKALFVGDLDEMPRAPRGDLDDFIASPFQRRELLGCVFELLHRVGDGENLVRGRRLVRHQS